MGFFCGMVIFVEMNILEALFLGILQGITEFLPISSSGHLVLFEDVLGMDVKELKNFDVLLHLGTLLAILLYFWKDIWVILKSLWNALSGKSNKEKVLNVNPLLFVWFLILGTIPAVLMAFSAEDFIDGFFRDARNVGYSFLLTAFFFIFAEWLAKKVKASNLDAKRSIWVGIFQAIAIIPGISRSGSTIGAGLIAGLKREDSARFSFLLGIPALLGAGIFIALDLGNSAGVAAELGLDIYLAGFFSAFVSGYLSILFLMRFLKAHSLAWFSVYLIPLGLYLLFT